MFNDYSTDNNYRAPSALAVAARAHEMEKKLRLEYDLERARLLAAQERAGARGTGGAGAIHQSWYSAAQQWLKEKVLYRGLAAERPIAAGKSRQAIWKFTGVHTAPLRLPAETVIPATGKPALAVGSSTFLIRDGKIAHMWSFWDSAAVLRQLGVIQIK